MVDKITMDYLENTEGVDKTKFGMQRVFVAITYIFMNFLIENLVMVDDKNNTDYSYLSYYKLFAGICALAVVLSFVRNLPRTAGSQGTFKSAIRLFKNPDYSFLIFIVLFFGITRSAMTNHLSIYFQDIMKFKEKKMVWINNFLY